MPAVWRGTFVGRQGEKKGEQYGSFGGMWGRYTVVIERESSRHTPKMEDWRNGPSRHKIASQVGVSHDLTKPVTPDSWPQVRKSAFAKPYDVNAPGPSRNSPKHVSFQSPRESVGSNDIGS
ncbi:hypothetical protein Tco_0355420 [Tanacetum coccineum]